MMTESQGTCHLDYLSKSMLIKMDFRRNKR